MLPDNPFTQSAIDSTDGVGVGLPFRRGTATGRLARRCTAPATPDFATANDFRLLAKRADDATALLKVLCNENRLLIFQLLVDNQMTVGEISRRTSRSQNDVSMNLEKLRRASLVQFNQQGKFRFYHVPDNHLRDLVLSILQNFEAVECSAS